MLIGTGRLNPQSLAGQTAIVTGAGRGIGFETARALIWLGARVVVLPGVQVAPGCIVGAGAVVTRDTEPDGVYVGVPARRIRDL